MRRNKAERARVDFEQDQVEATDTKHLTIVQALNPTVEPLFPTFEALFDVGLDFSSLGDDDPDTSKSPDRQKCFPERKSVNLKNTGR